MNLPSAPALAIACAVLTVIVVVLIAFIWSVKHHKAPTLHVKCDAPIVDLVCSIAGLTHGAQIEGNSVEILLNGAFFDVMIEEIGKATKSVHFETFLWKDGKLGNRLADALCERARAGVIVRVLVDANGCRGCGEKTEKKLEAAGCHFARYHPWKWSNIGVMNERDHRKIVVLDGMVGYTGGHCVVDEWMGDGEDRKHYRDLSVRVCGPIVHQLQSAFSENWVEVTGELFAGDAFFPPLEAAGDIPITAARMKPESSAPAVKILHHLVLCIARERLWIQNPYFLPEPEAIEAFADAVKRGVDVRVMVPSAEASDMPMVQHAAHRNFAKLLEAGVRIFEFPTTLMHQKVMAVDGIWCAVGTTNFDDRAFEINDEITLGIHSERVTLELESIFVEDMKVCKELDLASWKKRGLWHSLKDRAFYVINEHL
jgi:cardiolipin synthase